MKIVFVCNEYPPASSGGIGTFTRGLAESLVGRDWRVHVVGNYSDSSIERECAGGVLVSRLPLVAGLRGIVANRVSLYRELRRINAEGIIDVVEAPDFEGATAGLPRQSRVRLVRLHGSHRYFSDERKVQASHTISTMERIALRQADAIVSVSDYTARRTRDLFSLSCDIKTVHNAVKIAQGLPRKYNYQQQRRVLYFGTLAEKKGVLSLARAWKLFHVANPDWRLTLIGRDSTSSSGSSVKCAIVEALGESRRSVDFTGYLPNEQVMQRLTQFDFVALPSFSEAFALAPMEAMALGVPVVYSSMSSGRELITDGVDGWLCDPRSIESVLDALIRASGDSGARARIADAARRKVEHEFSYESFVDRNMEMYQSLLNPSGRSQ